MANENLKNALIQAGLTAEQFAQIIDVDPKTVQRWVSGRTPYPRHRATVARALEVSEHELWPDAVPEPPDPTVRSDDRPLGDVVGSWGQYTQPGVPDLLELIAQASGQIDVRHDGRLLRLSEPMINAIADRGRAGCQVRVISQWPTPELATLIGGQRTEVRVSQAVSDTCLVRCDDDMLLLLPLATRDRRMPAVLHLRRRVDGGLFDRFIEHLECEHTGDRTTAPLTDTDQLDPYLPANHDDHQDAGLEASQHTTPTASVAHDRESITASSEDRTRRWPGRPA